MNSVLRYRSPGFALHELSKPISRKIILKIVFLGRIGYAKRAKVEIRTSNGGGSILPSPHTTPSITAGVLRVDWILLRRCARTAYERQIPGAGERSAFGESVSEIACIAKVLDM